MWETGIFLVLGGISALSALANLLLLVVFCRKRGLRTVSNRFVINLLAANLACSLLLIPLMAIDHQLFLAPSAVLLPQDNVLVWGPSEALCRLSDGLSTSLCTSTILSILLIGLDQYLAVLHPLQYRTYMDRARSCLLVSLLWAIAVGTGCLSGAARARPMLWRSCLEEAGSAGGAAPGGGAFREWFAGVYFALVVVLPCAGVCGIYANIYLAARRNSRRQAVPQVKSSASLVTMDSQGGLLSSIKSRISNASAFRYREETRAAKISFLVVVLVVTCYLPYGLGLLLGLAGACGTAFAALPALSAVMSPFLFAYRNRRVRRELRRLFGRDSGPAEHWCAQPPLLVVEPAQNRASFSSSSSTQTSGDD